MSDNSVIDQEKSNEECVGPASDVAGKASGCSGCPNQNACASGKGKEVDPSIAIVSDRMSKIKHKILVLSGKGGVGKSTFSAQLSFALAQKGHQVGLLDVDICGPSIPRMLGLVGQEVHQSASGWSPVYVEDNLAVMSIGFMLPSVDDAIIWRGPRKNGLIKQFLTDVVWNELDYLIVDTPPGTSDEHISIVQYLQSTNIDGCVIVTTPQEVSMADVRKELNFCRKTGLKVLGIVENMSDFRIPFSSLSDPSNDIKIVNINGLDITESSLLKIKELFPELLNSFIQTPLFTIPSAEIHNTPIGMSQRFNVPYLGKLPMDPNLMKSCENGTSYLELYPTAPAAIALNIIVDQIIKYVTISSVGSDSVVDVVDDATVMEEV